MQHTEKSLKPRHLILIILMIALGGALFVFKDKVVPDINEPYKKQYSTYVKTPAVIISISGERGRRGRSRINATVQYRDGNGTLHTYRLDDNSLQSYNKGDTIDIYYDPENPSRNVVSEYVYKEVMGN